MAGLNDKILKYKYDQITCKEVIYRRISFFYVEKQNAKSSDYAVIVLSDLKRLVTILNRTGASPGNFFTVSGTARMVPAEAPKILIGSERSVLAQKTLKATLLSILKTM